MLSEGLPNFYFFSSWCQASISDLTHAKHVLYKPHESPLNVFRAEAHALYVGVFGSVVSTFWFPKHCQESLQNTEPGVALNSAGDDPKSKPQQ